MRCFQFWSRRLLYHCLIFTKAFPIMISLQWRHISVHSVPNHGQLNCCSAASNNVNVEVTWYWPVIRKTCPCPYIIMRLYLYIEISPVPLCPQVKSGIRWLLYCVKFIDDIIAFETSAIKLLPIGLIPAKMHLFPLISCYQLMMTSSNETKNAALLAICAGNSPVTGEFPHKGQWRGGLMFSVICACINSSVNNRKAGDLRRRHAHYDVTAMHCRANVFNHCCANFLKTSNKFAFLFISQHWHNDLYIYIYYTVSTIPDSTYPRQFTNYTIVAD